MKKRQANSQKYQKFFHKKINNVEKKGGRAPFLKGACFCLQFLGYIWYNDTIKGKRIKECTILLSI
jgi:hypothetical protein